MIGTPKLAWTSKRMNGFELDVNTAQPGILVVSQMDYPGWEAYVDGRSVDIRRANYAFPSIFVSPGPHHVRFSFEPRSFKVGLALSILATVAAAVMVLRGINRSNQNRV